MTSTGLVVSTGNNSATVGRARRTPGDWRSWSAPWERSIDVPAPTVDTRAGGKWRVHAPGQRVVTTRVDA